jgi:hypothetical protein
MRQDETGEHEPPWMWTSCILYTTAAAEGVVLQLMILDLSRWSPNAHDGFGMLMA